MKTASRAYKSQMAKSLRNHSYVGISFGNIDVSAGSDGAWNGIVLPWSKNTTLDYNHIYTENVATLELNRWRLNGSQKILQSNAVNDGLVAKQMSDANGFRQWIMTREFSYTHALSGITITFDGENGEFPLALRVMFYDDNGRRDIVVYPTSPTVEVEYASESVTKVELLFSKMLPYRRPRVQTTLWGIGYSYSNADIVNCNQSIDVDPLSRRLPQEKFSFTILDYEHKFDPDNPAGVYATINRGAPIRVSYGYELDDGTVEWLQSDTYSLDNKPTFANSKVTFNGTGLLATMTDSYYKGMLGMTNFYDLAVDVLEDANLTPSASGADPWDVDESLKNMYTTAPMPIQSHATCLQMIAHACNCRLYTDDQNVIHLTPFGVTPVGVFGGVLSDNGHAWISSWESVDYGGDRDATYVTLELNRWVLGSPQVIATVPISTPRGYVSDSMSDVNGENLGAVWTKRFNILHDIPRIVLTFDDVLEEYPEEITVTYYDRNDAVIGTKTVQPDAVTVNIDSEYEDCEYFTVAETSSRIPYRRARISRVAYFETDYALTLGAIKQDTLVTSKLDKLRNVTVAEYIHTQADTNRTKLYEATTDEEVLHIEYQLASDITITVTGGTVISQNVYSQAADLVLSAGTKTILVEGYSVNEGSVVHTYAYGSAGEDDIEENHLITNKAMADAHAEHVAIYLQLRNTYDAGYRGSPELEAGDMISLQTLYDNVVYGIVLVDSISFNGALNGQLKVKGLA